MPPVFEVSTFKLILQHVCAHNFLLTKYAILTLIDRLCSWTNIQQEKCNYSFHMSALFLCKNNSSKMAKSDENVLLYDVERLNSCLIKHRKIEHNIVSCLNVIERGEMGI